jgi:hypothetical protein
VVNPARGISPAAAARRALLVDSLVAFGIAAIALKLAGGLGVVGFIGLPLLVLGLLWIGSERILARLRRPESVGGIPMKTRQKRRARTGR